MSSLSSRIPFYFTTSTRLFFAASMLHNLFIIDIDLEWYDINMYEIINNDNLIISHTWMVALRSNPDQYQCSDMQGVS